MKINRIPAILVLAGAILLAGSAEVAGLDKILAPPPGQDPTVPFFVILVLGSLVSIANYSLQAFAGRRQGYCELAYPETQAWGGAERQRLLKGDRYKFLYKDVQNLNQLPKKIEAAERVIAAKREAYQIAKNQNAQKIQGLEKQKDDLLRRPSITCAWPPDQQKLYANLMQQRTQLLRDLRALEAAEKSEMDEGK